MLRLRAIRPRRAPIATNQDSLAREALGQTGFAGEVVREMADYPPQMPTVSGYRRTGDYGRNWIFSGPTSSGGRLFVDVYNPIRYAVRVGGPRPGPRRRRQTDEMARRRWPNITRVARSAALHHRITLTRIYTGRDARLRRDKL